MQVAFSEFRPFPSRGNIKSRCKPYLKEYFEEWKEREKMPAVSLIPSPIITPIHKPKKNSHWECGAIINSSKQRCYNNTQIITFFVRLCYVDQISTFVSPFHRGGVALFW